jgi:WW domain-containing oxidoreductase
MSLQGGSAGIGFGIAAHLLQHNPAKIYLLSNKEEHADDAIEELKKFGEPGRVEWIKCNLTNLNQTDEVAKKLKGELKLLDGICSGYKAMTRSKGLKISKSR